MTQQQTEMRKSWLVQRLTKPAPASPAFGKDNPFAFGGGLRNGGLSDEAMGLLRPIFGFDYMGAAEFEFGAVPKALNIIAKSARDLVAESFAIDLEDVAAPWREKQAPSGLRTIYLLCVKEHRDEVERRVREWAAEEYGRDLKESTRLNSALRPVNEWDTRVAGWLELNNGFMFFTDEAMWRGTAAVFGVEA